DLLPLRVSQFKASHQAHMGPIPRPVNPLQRRPSTAQTRSAVEATRRDLHISGSSFTVGAERYAADGSRWKRVA
ncbi:hypothetical protein, partial [Methylobacterium sp. Leaf361]|uniref:hypothetical protein n=1 Tax=Methylobacterium sp. Leaf361 TaxID=1736352 RepID=UPI000A98408E